MGIQAVGLILASVGVGALVATGRHISLPGLRWAIAGAVMFDITLLYYRIRLLTNDAPINIGDFGFILANVLIVIGCLRFLRQTDREPMRHEEEDE